MRLLLALMFAGFASAAYGQTDPTVIVPDDTLEIELAVGDSMEIGICPGDHYLYLDFFRKTRWAGNEEPYDTSTGHGFYQSFFTSGDFNALELEPSYRGRRFAILGMEVLVNKNTGADMAVMYLTGPEPNSVIWVDYYDALEKKEIGLPGQDFLAK